MKKHSFWLFILFALMAVGAGAASYQWLRPKPSEQVLVYPQPKPLPEFVMTDHRGQLFDNQRLQGRWSLLFIGYTFCPDVCPATLSMLTGIYPRLSKAMGEGPQVVFISADPERDSQQQLARYIDYFSASFTAIYGPHQQLYPFATSMGFIYARHDRADSDAYLVDHSASIVLINPQGQVAALFRPQPDANGIYTVKAETLLQDLPILTRQ